ncbi:PepSY domain-containing protein [Streptomyces sp. LN325]|uniref:PepSY domain-containing protein n=1 Tax=Streptomyces sp. LN325 TaxID=3112976 RepID=UPI00371C7629
MKRNIVIAAVAAAALIGGGTATALAVTDDSTAAVPGSSSRTADDDRAGHVRHGDDTRADDRTRTGGPTRTDDHPHPDDRTRTGHHTAGSDDHGDDAARLRSARVTAAEALGTALRHTPGTAASAGLDDDRATPTWEIRILATGRTWYEVRVDAGTGKVVSARTEPRTGVATTTDSRGPARRLAAREGPAFGAGPSSPSVPGTPRKRQGRTHDRPGVGGTRSPTIPRRAPSGLGQARQVSVRPRQVSVRPRQVSVRPRQVSVRPSTRESAAR